MEEVEYREYQVRAVGNTVKAVADGHEHILLLSPTGSGKTVMALTIAKMLREIYGYTTGWCAMRRHLLLQASDENDGKVGEPIQFFSMFDKDPPHSDVLIFDEGHHTAADSAITIYRKVHPKIHLGLTATPFRLDRQKLCFSKIIQDCGIRALIDQGYLAPYHHYTFDKPWTPENVADVYLKSKARWGKTVGYFLTKNECDACADIIRAAGTPCEVVWADSDQESQINAFRSGDVPILLNMVILTEGFDCPDLQTVFVRPSSKGPAIQMTGRVLRPKPYAQVVQNNDTNWPFTRTASPEQKFVLNQHGEWENRDAESGIITAASHNSMLAITRIQVDIPKFISKHRKKPRMFGHEVL